MIWKKGKKVCIFVLIVSIILLEPAVTCMSIEGKQTANKNIIKQFQRIGGDNSLLSRIVTEKNHINIYLPSNISEDSRNQLDLLLDKYKKSNDSKEKEHSICQIFEVLRNEKYIPSSLTLSNLYQLADAFQNQNVGKHNRNIYDEKISPYKISPTKLDSGEPIVGLGAFGLIITGGAQVFSLPMVPLSELIISFWEKEIELFEESEGNPALNFTSTLGSYGSVFLFGYSAFTYGRVISALPPKDNYWVGPFYSIWGVSIGGSVTIYYTGPPTEVLMDILIVAGGACMLNPFSYEG